MLRVSIGQFSKSVVLENFLRAIEKNPEGTKAEFDIAMKRLRRTKEANPEIYEFLLLDKNGRVVASSRETNVGVDKSTDAFFTGAQKGIFIKDAYYSEELKERLIATAAPFLDSDTGKIIGVLVARVKMDGLDKITLESGNTSKTGEVYIVNKYGYMITPSIFLKDTFLKQRIDSANFRDALFHRGQGDAGFRGDVIISPDYRGVKVLGVHKYIPEMQWYVLSEIDESEAFAPLAKLYFVFLFILFMVPSCAYVLGIYLSRRITEPIHKLHKGTEIIGEGNLDYKVGIDAKDEIGQLSRSFDEMTAHLRKSTTSIENLNQEIALRKKTEETLYKSEEQYRLLFTESRDAVMILLPEQGFISGNPAAIEMFGCKDEEDFKSKTPAELSPEFQPDGLRSSDKAREMVVLAVENGSNLFEWTHKSLDDKEFIATVLLSRFMIGGKTLLQATVRDITEQKRQEIALRKSEAWFSTTLSSIGDAVITVDTVGKVTFINPVAQKLTGWLGSEAIGRHIDEVFVIRKEDTDEKVENPVLKVLSNGEIVKLANHTILIAKDANRYAIDDSAAPIRAVNSKEILGVVLIFRDVTERNKAERELHELSVAVEQSPVCVVITDLNGNIQYVNPKFIELTGYAFAEVVGKNPRVLKSGEHSADFYKDLWDTITSGKEWRGEFHNKNKNGELYWEGASISPIRNNEGKITNFIGIKEDITERKRIYDELGQAAQEWQRTFDSMSDIVFIQDKDFTILKANKACLEALKLKSEDVVGKKCFTVLHHLDHPWMNCPFVQTCRDKKVHTAEVDDPGLGASLLVTTSPIIKENGEFMGSIHVAKDISLIKKYQNELELKNKELEKLDQLKSDFVSMVSHELRSPLSITKEGLSLVLDGVTGTINAKQSKILTTSKNSIDRLARIINSLLDISKIESGRVELKKQSVDMEALIRNVAVEFENQAKDKGLELRVNLTNAKGLKLYIDEDRIIQVFTNLISNSIKFTEQGHIDVTLVQRKDEVEFIVSDTGVGIAAEDLPRVFTKFLQFGRTAGAGGKGSGLGLSITKGIIDLHRGKIWVESEVDRGSKFIFSLPKYSMDQNAREYIEDAIADAIRSSSCMTLAIAAVSFPDEIRNTYEGLADELLKVIKTQLYRDKDLALKYPNEFVIIMEDCDKSNGLIVQGRIELALRSYLDSINLSKDLKIVFGLATYPDDANNYQDLVNKAKLV